MKLVIIFSILLLFNTCGEKNTSNMKLTDSLNVEITPDQISNDVKVIFADSSFTKAILYADRARVFQAKMETLLDGGVKVEFLSRFNGNRVSYLTSDSARIDDKTRNMLAKGNVIVISDSTHTRLETSVLEWNNETQKLYSTEFVKIKSPYETLQGYGFESDQHLSNYKIFRVSGEQSQNKSGISNKPD